MTGEKRYFSLFPKTLAACIEPLTRPVLKAQGLAGSRILTEWPSIIGPEYAARCIPQKLSFPPGKRTNGTLTIAAENGFATALQHLQPVILERLATYFGYTAIDRIAIANTYVPSQPSTPPAPAKPVLSGDCADMVKDVEDGELKAALTSLAKTLAGETT